METQKNRMAKSLFNGIASYYDFWAQVLSLFQYRRWRLFLVSLLTVDEGSRVLDVSTGTAGAAIEVARRYGSRVVGLDISEKMLEQSRRNVDQAGLDRLIELVPGRAEALDYPDGSFDAVIFTYLLRYVDTPAKTIEELARVLKPGGQLVSLEFYLPGNRIFRLLWLLYTGVLLPMLTMLISPGWKRVGRFLGPSITSFYRRHTLAEIETMWTNAGIQGVQSRLHSFGGAVITWGIKGGVNYPGATGSRPTCQIRETLI